MAENDPTEQVTIRDPETLSERDVPRGALPFFLNQGFEVLDSRGRVSASATAAAKKEQ